MSHFVVLFDACVFYPAPLRDLLIRLSMTGLFRAKWTDRIDQEWIEGLLRNRPELTRRQLDRTRMLMREAVPDCLVTGYEGLIETLTLPDPDDRHVLAAAIRAQAGVIVTLNLRDFPREVLAPHNVEAQHPDVFIQHLISIDLAIVCKTVREQRQALSTPPYPARTLLDRFLALGLASTVAELEPMRDLL